MNCKHKSDFEAWIATLPYNPDMRMIEDNYRCALTQNLWSGFVAGREFNK